VPWLGQDQTEQLDLFDAMQLKAVIGVCRQSKSLSDAGRKLFAVSHRATEKPNDADRLKKYLAKFALTWDSLQRTARAGCSMPAYLQRAFACGCLGWTLANSSPSFPRRRENEAAVSRNGHPWNDHAVASSYRSNFLPQP
jgi:hypothetical protein